MHLIINQNDKINKLALKRHAKRVNISKPNKLILQAPYLALPPQPCDSLLQELVRYIKQEEPQNHTHKTKHITLHTWS